MIRLSPYSYMFILCWLFLLVPVSLPAQSPFQDPTGQADKNRKQPSVSPGDLLPDWIKGPVNKAMGRITTWQALVRNKAGAYARQIRDNPWGVAFWSYLGLAFAYGVIHALGPGHGKVFVSTYFLSRQASPGQAVLMASALSFLHVLSAVILVFLFYYIVKSGGLKSVDEAGTYLQKISAGLICLVGLFLAAKSARAIYAESTKDLPAEDHDSPPFLRNSDTKSILSLGLAVGLVPCPGAALILFFSITLNILAAGIAAMFFLALGLAVTTVSFALISLLARNTVAGFTSGAAMINPRLYHLPALAGALLIAGLGAALFLTAS